MLYIPLDKLDPDLTDAIIDDFDAPHPFREAALELVSIQGMDLLKLEHDVHSTVYFKCLCFGKPAFDAAMLLYAELSEWVHTDPRLHPENLSFNMGHEYIDDYIGFATPITMQYSNNAEQFDDHPLSLADTVEAMNLISRKVCRLSAGDLQQPKFIAQLMLQKPTDAV